MSLNPAIDMRDAIPDGDQFIVESGNAPFGDEQVGRALAGAQAGSVRWAGNDLETVGEHYDTRLTGVAVESARRRRTGARTIFRQPR
jgi:hypothetical protein